MILGENFEWLALWAFLLLPLPFFIRLFLPAKTSPEVTGVDLPFSGQLAESNNLSDANTPPSSLLKKILATLIWFAVIIACAGPQWVGEPIPLPQAGRDMLMAIDVSGSMDERDMIYNGQAYSRLDAVKVMASDFLEERKGDRIGLILFGDQAYLQTPLTFDIPSVKKMLIESEVGLAGKQTALGDAIGLAIKRLENQENQDKVLILLTDGRKTAGETDPIEAAQMAQEQGMKIYTIGVGGEGRRRGGFFGGFMSMGGNELDEQTLEQIAQISGGNYYRARNPKELAEIYNELNQIEAIEKDEQVYRPTKNLFYYPLAAALILSLLLALAQLKFKLVALLTPQKAARNV